MRDEIVEALRDMIAALVSMPVVIGSMPPEQGYAVGMGSGAPLEIFRTLSTNEELPVLFNGKGPDQRQIAAEMDRVHHLLTTATALPFTDRWQVYAIVTTSSPNLISREQNKNWVYGSSLRISFYAKEV